MHNTCLSLVFPDSVAINCYFVGSQITRNGSKTIYSDAVDNTFLWLIGPQILNGLAQVLVNMTVLEFLCAQAPCTMQGLLIGLWYALFSVRYLLMKTLDGIFASGTTYHACLSVGENVPLSWCH